MRITEKQLEAKINYLNKITNSPETYGQREDDKLIINVGHYHLDINIGGYQLVRTMNDGGGVSCPLGYFRGSKGELARLIDAFVAGISLKSCQIKLNNHETTENEYQTLRR